ncbi:hypothetical protein HW555_013940, partial [Spodoptera exigua]
MYSVDMAGGAFAVACGTGWKLYSWRRRSKGAWFSGTSRTLLFPLESSCLRIIVSAIVLRNVIGRPVDLLIGADVLGLLQLGSSKLLQSGGLVSVATDLGDIIMGPVLSPCPLQGEDDNLQVGLSLAECVQRFWEGRAPFCSSSKPRALGMRIVLPEQHGSFCSG